MRAGSAVISETRIHISYTLAVAALLLAMGMMQHRIDELDHADDFYRWMIARETRITIESATAEPALEEDEFFEKVRTQGSKLATERWPSVTDIVSEQATPQQKWDIVRSKAFTDLRAEFSSLLRNGKLTSVKGFIDWQKQDVGQHLGALLLGFRTAVADLLWLKVDEYWHDGNLHRMLPMMHTVVRLDPHFIVAYSIGAWHLAYNAVAAMTNEVDKQRYIQEGIAFLEDGIAKNPFDHRLYFELGYTIYDQKLQDYPNSVKYLELANRYDPPVWVQRMLLHAYENNEQFETALDGWRRYLVRHPDNIVAPRFIAELNAVIAMLAGDELRVRELWQRVFDSFPGANIRADIELTKIDARRTESMGNLEEALDMWRSLVVKKYPQALDVALSNIRRLHEILGLPQIREGDLGIWDVLDDAEN